MHADLLADQEHSVERADLGATRGVFYRLRVGPLDSEAGAAALCGELKRREPDCFVVSSDQGRAN